jgi:hypothetical protein
MERLGEDLARTLERMDEQIWRTLKIRSGNDLSDINRAMDLKSVWERVIERMRYELQEDNFHVLRSMLTIVVSTP